MDSQQNDWKYYIFTDNNNEKEILAVNSGDETKGVSEYNSGESNDLLSRLWLCFIFGLAVIVIVVIRIYLRYLCCRMMISNDSQCSTSTGRIYTLPHSGMGQSVPNQIASRAYIIPTQQVEAGMGAQEANKTLHKYLMPTNSDDHIIDVDHKQALL